MSFGSHSCSSRSDFQRPTFHSFWWVGLLSSLLECGAIFGSYFFPSWRLFFDVGIAMQWSFTSNSWRVTINDPVHHFILQVNRFDIVFVLLLNWIMKPCNPWIYYQDNPIAWRRPTTRFNHSCHSVPTYLHAGIAMCATWKGGGPSSGKKVLRIDHLTTRNRHFLNPRYYPGSVSPAGRPWPCHLDHILVQVDPISRGQLSIAFGEWAY